MADSGIDHRFYSNNGPRKRTGEAPCGILKPWVTREAYELTCAVIGVVCIVYFCARILIKESHFSGFRGATFQGYGESGSSTTRE